MDVPPFLTQHWMNSDRRSHFCFSFLNVCAGAILLLLLSCGHFCCARADGICSESCSHESNRLVDQYHTDKECGVVIAGAHNASPSTALHKRGARREREGQFETQKGLQKASDAHTTTLITYPHETIATGFESPFGRCAGWAQWLALFLPFEVVAGKECVF